MQRRLLIWLCCCTVVPALMAADTATEKGPTEKKADGQSVGCAGQAAGTGKATCSKAAGAKAGCAMGAGAKAGCPMAAKASEGGAGGCCGGGGATADKASGSKAEAGKQTVCPISGKPIKPEFAAEYDGQKVYFCGPGCQKQFKASPTKFLPAVYKQLYPQRVQVKCPVMGETIDPKVSTEINGERVYVCCKSCIAKLKADPAKYADKLAASFTEQVHCPVSGDPIDPTVSIEENGKKVFFCCKDCVAKYKADPAKYADALRPTAGLLAYGKTAGDDLVLCPKCAGKGDALKRSDLKVTVVDDGIKYQFCCGGCATAFKADRATYKKALHDEMVKRITPERAFSCPMHPDIVQTGPGTCPRCGMKLEATKSKS